MNDVYVHTLRYRYSGWGKHRRSSTMFPVSYGPFRDEDSAREWIRQRGILRATKLMYGPAAENIKISHPHPIDEKNNSRSSFLRGRMRGDLTP